MLFLNWTRVAILYEDEYGLIRLQELVRSPPTKNIEIYIRQTNPANYRTVLREIKNKEIFNIIVDTDKEHIQLFFRTLLQLQMNNNKVSNTTRESLGCVYYYYFPYKHNSQILFANLSINNSQIYSSRRSTQAKVLQFRTPIISIFLATFPCNSLWSGA